MAHFAQLDDDNNVIRVIKIDNLCCLDDTGTESEAVGVAFCQNLYGKDTRWLQTSINKSIRKQFATVGSYYDPVHDAFIPKKFFPSWSLNLDTFEWDPPIPRPVVDEWMIWLESEQRWVVAADLAGIDANTEDSIYREA